MPGRRKTFLTSYGIAQANIDTVWNAVALHTTPGIPRHMHPVVALVTAGVEMDVLGLTYADYAADVREALVRAYPHFHRGNFCSVIRGSAWPG